MLDEYGNGLNMLEMTDLKDLIPKAMKPEDFEALDKEFHMAELGNETDADIEDVKPKDNS